jgi:hypothetical protein
MFWRSPLRAAMERLEKENGKEFVIPFICSSEHKRNIENQYNNKLKNKVKKERK